MTQAMRCLGLLDVEQETKLMAAIFTKHLRDIRDDETKPTDVRRLAGLELEHYLAELADGGF